MSETEKKFIVRKLRPGQVVHVGQTTIRIRTQSKTEEIVIETPKENWVCIVNGGDSRVES